MSHSFRQPNRRCQCSRDCLDGENPFSYVAEGPFPCPCILRLFGNRLSKWMARMPSAVQLMTPMSDSDKNGGHVPHLYANRPSKLRVSTLLLAAEGPGNKPHSFR